MAAIDGFCFQFAETEKNISFEVDNILLKKMAVMNESEYF